MDVTTPSISISLDQQVEQLETLCKSGRYHDAYKQGLEWWGDIRFWENTNGLSATILNRLGGDRLADAITIRAWRKQPHHHDNSLAYAAYLGNTRGPIECLSFIQENEHLANGSSQKQHEWQVIKAQSLLRFRDFSEAHRLLDDVLLHDPNNLGALFTKGQILLEQKAFTELAKYWQSLYQSTPRESVLAYWISATAASNSRAKAIKLAESHINEYQSCRLWCQLASLYQSEQNWEKVAYTVQKAASLAVVADKSFKGYIESQLARLALEESNYDKARIHLSLCKDGYHQALLKRLDRQVKDQRRVILDVPYMRQQHLTCAPTTMSALLNYWGLSHSSEDIAKEICYHGTPDHLQRNWLKQKDIPFRSFELTWDAAISLLDAGFPFALVTHSSMNSHMQAVVGYDSVSRIFYLMDPSSSSKVEMLADEVIEDLQFTGPKALVFAPGEQFEQLKKFDLAGAEEYLVYERFSDAIEQGQQQLAAEMVLLLEQEHADHRLTLCAHRELAQYRLDHKETLRYTLALLERYPNESRLIRSAFHSYNANGDAERALSFARQKVNVRKDPTFLLMLANQLYSMKKHREEVSSYTRLLRRYCWHEAEALWTLANWQWAHQSFDKALQLYRWAATSDEANETSAMSYFQALRSQKQEDAGIEFLQKRFERYGDKAAGPAITLYQAYEMLDLEHNGLAVLEQACKKRAEDPELIEFCLEQLLTSGQFKQYDTLFSEKSAHLSNEQAKLLTAKSLLQQGHLEQAKQLYYLQHQQQPLNRTIGDHLCRLMAKMEDMETLDGYLETQIESHPNLWTPLWLIADWHSNGQKRIDALKALTERFEDHTEAHYQLIRTLISEQAEDKALKLAEALVEQIPQLAEVHSVYAEALNANQRWLEARNAALHALSINIDSDSAMTALMRACTNIDEKQQALESAIQYLSEQSVFGDALWNIYYWGSDILTPARLIELCKEWRSNYPDCWESWLASALIYRQQNQLEKAANHLVTAKQRFPLVPRVHYELGENYFLMGQIDQAITAFGDALALSPQWHSVSQRLSEMYESQHQLKLAADVLQKAQRHQPDNGILFGMEADLQWQQGQYKEALDNLKKAVKLNMQYPWGWQSLKEWGREQQQPNLAKQLAQEFADDNPNTPIVWLNLAEHSEIKDVSEKEALIRKALTLNPNYAAAQSALLDLHIEQYRFDDAIDEIDAQEQNKQTAPSVRLRRVEIFWRTGRLEEALQASLGLMNECPDYAEGWRQQARLAEDCANKTAAMDAAVQLAKHNPHEARHLVFAANVLQRLKGATPQIEQWLARAFSIQPQDDVVSLSWLDHLLAQRQFEQAIMVEKKIAQFDDNAWLWVRKIQRLCLSNEHENALPIWQQVIDSREDNNWIYETGLAHFGDTISASKAEAKLKWGVENNRISPKAAYLWATKQVHAKDRLSLIRTIDHAEESLWEPLVMAYFDTLEEAGLLAAASFLQRHKNRMERSCHMIGRYGYLLQVNNCFYEALKWYALLPTKQPEQVDGYIWYQYQWALRHLNRWSEAKRINMLAIACEPDVCYDSILLWRALDLSMAGHQEGPNVLANLNRDTLTLTEQRLYDWCQLYTALLEHDIETLLSSHKKQLAALRYHRKQASDCGMTARVRNHFITAALSTLQTNNPLKSLWWRFKISNRL
ncbi:tetratricopeptide repeat protein [Corallincola luteus]|uniref:Tetratricopeptide repeat protein n=1 Tax=Corallincola luteus TaxID=1775177 RepID=A0ABY2AKQ7_9GAMM|nr:tetratricopeptide repeat protein [Corallincola luteus]TCI02023.1 tetratricopeptide repeat protein [Corallincola luteus]